MSKGLTIIGLIMGLILFGCAHFEKAKVAEGEKKAKEGPALNQVFYNFPDIPIPKELELVSDRSFIYESPGIKAGVLVFRGNVDVDSLQNYFKINMSKNGWRFVNSFRFREIMLNYAKDDKTCTIKISREGFTTDVEISVGPQAGISPSPRGPEK
ncbi:MAG: hypothetical protein NZ583_01490 [Desulfobacterota bacterium]|nr:hypothetical protein [Thermodesulfobacteriota bacterium]MDW8001387.1 hypothetical protein [Deltaproteobacteria bacterium]